MKYIKNDKLYLGSKEATIKENLTDILQYIYDACPLNYNKMKKLYEHIEVDNNYDCDFLGLKFENNLTEDDKYVYELIDEMNIENYDNVELIEELHNYLIQQRSARKLRINNVSKIKLINETGMNDYIFGIEELDWKLHYWAEYMVSNENNVRLHDLIIAAWKIKSHKFDLFYESCNGIKELGVLDHGYGTKREITAVISFN